MKKNINLIEKKDLVSYITHSNIKYCSKFHILSIISILFEEIYKDLKAGKPLIIKNFGKLVLKTRKNPQDKTISPNTSFFKKLYYTFTFERKIHLKLIRSLDIDSLGKDEQTEQVK